MEELKDRVKFLRDLSKKTQEEFGKPLGYDKGTVSNWEKGTEPSATALKQLRRKYNVNINWLLTGRGEMYLAKDEHSENIFEKLQEEMKNGRAAIKQLEQLKKILLSDF